MSTARFAVVLLAAACSSKPSPSKTEGSNAGSATGSARPVVPDAGEIPATCVPAAIADRGVAYVRTDGARATICYGDGSDSRDAVNLCRVIDETGAIVGPRTWDDAMAARKRETGRLDPHTVTIDASTVSVCPPIGDRCRSFAARISTVHPNRPPAGFSNLDGSRAFVFVPQPVPGKDPVATWYGDVYDVASGKRLSRTRLSKLVDPLAFTDTFSLFEGQLLGEQVIVTDRVETGPYQLTLLLDPRTGNAIELSDTESSHVVIDVDTIVTVRGRTVGLVDVPTLETVASVTVPGGSTDNPNKPVAVTRFGGSLLVAYAKPAGTIAIDLETRAATAPRPLPVCP